MVRSARWLRIRARRPGGIERVKLPTQELRVSRRPAPRGGSDAGHQRLLAIGHRLQEGRDRLDRLERVHARCPPADLAKRLRPAQEQLGEHDELARRNLERLVRDVTHLLDPAAAEHHFPHEALAPETVEGGDDVIVREVHDGLAIALLVRARSDRVQREGVFEPASSGPSRPARRVRDIRGETLASGAV